ncbi:MAG: response regulator [Nitrospirales bacterium]|nr:MAG: response regulator [Nitrospirales bacterium]
MSNLSASSSSTILLVDDEPDILRSLQLILKPEGYNIDVTSTGASALEAIKEHSYDAVLLDVGLPDMDGLLVLKKMTEYRPDLPVIILTSFTSLESVIGPLEDQGAFAYLHKPINRSEITTTIRHALKAHSMAKKIEQTHHSLMESENRFQAVFQSATDAIVLANHTGRIMAWNPAAELMFGYTADEVFGQPLTIIMPPRYRAAHSQGLDRVNKTGETKMIGKTVPLHGLRKNGQEFPIEISLNSWTTGAHPSYSGFIRDISRRPPTEVNT